MHYEAPPQGSHRVRGHALLMRKGMAAWMCGVGAGSQRAAAPEAAPAEQPLPVDIAPHLVDILATMVLASTAMEVVP